MKRIAVILICLTFQVLTFAQTTGTYWKVDDYGSVIGGKGLPVNGLLRMNLQPGWWKATQAIPATMTVQQAIGNGYIELDESASVGLNPKMYLPEKIHVTTESEFNLWWDAVSLYQPSENIRFKVKCTMPGLWVLNRGIRIPWETSTGSYPITIYAKNSNNVIIDSVSSVIEVVSASAGTGSYNVMMIGDSRTWQNISNQNGYGYTGGGGGRTITTQFRTLNSYYPTIGVNFIGSQGTNPTKNEAYSGWSLTNFLGTSSPFWYSGTINFRAYMASRYTASDSLNVVTIMMGVNDIWSAVTGETGNDLSISAIARIPAAIANMKTLIAKIIDPVYGYPNCKIILVLEPTTSSQTGFGAWYGNVEGNGTLEMWACENALRELRRQIISEFDGARYSSKVTISIAGLECDRTYGFPYTRFRSSLRANDTTEIYHNNSIHPHDVGYKQIADGIYATFRYVISNGIGVVNPNLITNGTFVNAEGWSLLSGWSISDNKAFCNGTGLNMWFVASLLNSTTYTLTYTASITSGELTPFMGGASSTSGVVRTGSGTYSEDIVSPATAYGSVGFHGTFVGYISNVSLRKK